MKSDEELGGKEIDLKRLERRLRVYERWKLRGCKLERGQNVQSVCYIRKDIQRPTSVIG
jgi:hypothetical protein